MAILAQGSVNERISHPSSPGRVVSAGVVGVGRVLCLLPLLLAGCVTTENATHKDTKKPPPPGEPCQIVTTWQNSMAYTPDPTRNGHPGQGLAGRLYMFGPEISHPMTGDGWLVVDMYDETGGQAVQIEQWRIDPDTLKKLVKRDMIGWGYTVFLPSKCYRPEMSKLRLRTRFQPKKGAPLFTENVVTMAPGNGVIRQGQGPVTSPPAAPSSVPAAPLPATPTLPAPLPTR